MEIRKPLPIGIEDFKDVKETCYYVDKTPLIKKIVGAPPTSAILFTRPRRFGKSLTLSMLKYFFELSSEDRTSIFSDTAIYEEKEIFSTYFGKFPVIHLNLKNASGTNKAFLMTKVESCLKDEYERHSYLLNSDALSSRDKDYFNAFLSGALDEASLSSSLKRLSTFLTLHHKRRTIILIDEYDTPIRYAHEHGYYDEVITFFKSLFGEALKGNPDVYYAILTGILQVSKESIFSGLNNLVVNNVLNESMNEGFGFTEEEVKVMLSHYDLEEKMDVFREWYDGYLFGKTKIYNPLSVISAVNGGGRIEPYWSNTSEQSSIRELIAKNSFDASFISSLLVNKRIQSEVNLAISYLDLDSSSVYLPSYLLATGYLTVEKELSYDTYILKVPNKEIESVFEKEIVWRYLQKDASSLPDELRSAFLRGEEKKVETILENRILSGLSYYDFGSEKAYQMMVYSVISLVLKDYKIRTEVNAGYGRSDIIAFPLDPNKPGLVLEIKASPYRLSSSRLLASSKKSLRQAESKGYVDEFIGSNVKKVIIYGFSFAAKSVSSVAKEVTLP